MTTKERDPVCGMFVDVRWPPATAVLGGRTHYFCALECKQAFLELGLADGPDGESGSLLDRHGRPLAAPRNAHGMVTILFSDVEASTVLMQEMGQQAAHAAVRAELERQELAVHRHGGTVVKWLGDGMMAAFTAARAGLFCAIEMLCDDVEGARIPVRVGMHTGQVIADGGDYFGKTVTMAARLTARARAGEIVMTEGLRSLLDPPEGWRFGRSRRVRLKGILGWQRVVALERSQPQPESR